MRNNVWKAKINKKWMNILDAKMLTFLVIYESTKILWMQSKIKLYKYVGILKLKASTNFDEKTCNNKNLIATQCETC